MRRSGDKPAKPKTVHNDTVTIRQLVNFAFKRRMIAEDPLTGLKIKKPRRTPQPCWTRDERVVPMSDRLYELLQSMSRGGRWVFTARVTSRHPQAGRQISARRLLQYLKRDLKRLGLPGHLHTFRHSFNSFAAYEGVSERVLRKWIGHVDRDVLNWYFHLADPQSQEAMQQLSEAARRKKSTNITDSNSAQTQHKSRRDENGKSAK